MSSAYNVKKSGKSPHLNSGAVTTLPRPCVINALERSLVQLFTSTNWKKAILIVLARLKIIATSFNASINDGVWDEH